MSHSETRHPWTQQVPAYHWLCETVHGPGECPHWQLRSHVAGGNGIVMTANPWTVDRSAEGTMTKQGRHTLKLQVVDEGDPDACHPAIVTGKYVRIIVDHSEDFGDPAPIAHLIVRAVNSHEELVAALKDLRYAATLAYQQGRIEAEPFVRAGNVLARAEGREDK